VILLLDIGNTRVKWGWLEGGQVRAGGVAMHKRDPALILQGWTLAEPPEQLLVVSVAGAELTETALAWARQNWGIEPGLLRAGSGAELLGVTTAYRHPDKLGADRWAAAVGAYVASRSAVCVVDCGSAITVDAVDATGKHLGGLIMPGWRLMRAALHFGTAALPLADTEAVQLFALDTVDAIVSGTMLGAAAMVENLTQRMLSEMDEPAELWLTGGDAAHLLPYLQHEFRHAPGLVLQGLAAMAESFKDQTPLPR